MNYKFKYLVLTIFLFPCSLRADAAPFEKTESTTSYRRFVKEKDTLNLVDEKGEVMNAVNLYKDVKYKSVKGRDGKDYQIAAKHWVLAKPSDNGAFAAVVRSTMVYFMNSEKVLEITSTIQYLDVNGKVLWEKPDIRSNYLNIDWDVHMSTDGTRIVFVLAKYDYHILPPDSTEWMAAYDWQGNELLKLGPFPLGPYINIFLTTNGNYGYIYTKPGYLCFSLKTQKTKLISKQQFRGCSVSINNEGKISVVCKQMNPETTKVIEEKVYEYQIE